MNAILMLMLAADPGGQAAVPDIVLLDFTASYCGPCQQMVPALQRMEQDGYPLRKIDITTDPQTSRKFHVERIPTFVLLVEGKEVKRFQGLTAEDELRREMRKAAAALADARAEQANGATIAASEERPEAQDSSTAQSATRQSVSSTAAPNARRSVTDLFRDMFQPDRKSGFEFPTVRAQNDDSLAGVPQPLTVAAAATVRVRVAGDRMQDVGTGTVIYSTTGRSLILTCAHLFQGQDNAKIEVEVFREGQVARFPATKVGGSHDSDLAILQIQNATPMASVPVPLLAVPTSAGHVACSFGCDNGQRPSMLSTKILRVNQFNGPANLTCAKDPVKGRSGGGLFTERGEFLGVCSAADRTEKQGLYMSQPAVAELLTQLKLDHILQNGSAGENASMEFAEAERAPVNAVAAAPPERVRPTQPAAAPLWDAAPAEETAINAPAPAVTAGRNDGGMMAIADNSSGTGRSMASVAEVGPEVTVMIKSQDPTVPTRTIVIPRATAWLVELLTGESGAATSPASGSFAMNPAGRVN